MQATVKVMGGLEITVEFTACRAEPDVGIMRDYVEEWDIVEIAGRPLRKKESAAWLYKRIDAKKGEDQHSVVIHAEDNALKQTHNAESVAGYTLCVIADFDENDGDVRFFCTKCGEYFKVLEELLP